MHDCCQGLHTREGVVYDEVFDRCAELIAIRLFLDYASFKDFVVYQMDIKSAFLYEKIEEEVYVCQPPGFEDPNFSDRVYKTLFIRRHKGDILLVQVYVDAIIFGSIKKELCNAFEKLMHEKFQMYSMGELTFFLGLQVKQKKDGIFISQDKYVDEIFKKFGFTEVKTEYTDSDYARACLDRKSTTGCCQFLRCRLISWHSKKPTLVANSTTKTEYVAASSCCGQFWSTVKAKNINEEEQLHALVDGKKIIITESSVRRDLQLADEEGIYCLPNSTIFEQLTPMGPKTTAWNEFSSTMASAIICLATNQKFNFSKFIFESMIRNLDNVSGKFLMYLRFVQVFLDQQLDGMPTHKRIYIAPSHTKKIFRNMRRVGKGFSGRVTPLFQTMVVQNQSQMGKGSAILTDPQHIPTIIQPSTQPQKTQKPRKPKRKDTQVPQSSDPSENVADKAVHKELGDSLVRAVTTASSIEVEVESSGDEESFGEDASKQGRIDAIDANEEITLVSAQNVDEEMFDVNLLDGEEVFIAEQEVAANKENDEVNVVKEVVEVISVAGNVVSTAGNVVSTAGDATTVSAGTTTTNDDSDITLAQAPIEMKCTKPKDNGKGILIELEKPMKKKDQIRRDEETALKLQAKFDEEERLAREKAKIEKEANIALIETWDDIQAKIDADYQLVEDCKTQEQEENMEGYKIKDLKLKKFDSIQEMFDRAFKRVNTFEDFRTELVEGKEKRAGTELVQEITKKQKVEDDKETA
ncbi:putative ribonuclease H-like domain-containing protein [Tanacetum coccineum]